MEFKFITTKDREYQGELRLRYEVLRKPLAMPKGSETFPFEDECIHLVAVEEGRVIGCLMFKPEGRCGRMLQMAVEKKLRGQGIGKSLVDNMIDRLKKEGFEEVYGHARLEVVSLYEKYGGKAEGEVFIEIGISHRIVRKKL